MNIVQILLKSTACK